MPISKYWTRAIEVVNERRQRIVKDVPDSGEVSDEEWVQLERLAWLQRFAETCKRLKEQNR